MNALMLSLITALMALGIPLAAQNNQTYIGEIIDGPCAAHGSHDAMTKAHPSMTSAKDCALACVKAGSQYVLYDSATKTAYQLDGQKKVKRFAGEKVTTTGSLDAASKTIHIVDVKAAS